MFLIYKKVSIVIVFLISLASCDEKQIEPETYLIPEGYVGNFNVIYNVKSGLAPEYEGEARVFRVPETGMIHTQFPQNYGIGYAGMIRFYYVAADGTRKEITDSYGSAIEDTNKNRQDKKIYVMGGGFGEFGFNQDTSNRGCKYNHQSFYVGTLSNRLEGVGHFRFEEYYLKYGYPCP